MNKRFFAILLAALMVLPFSVMANAAAPAEPVLAKTDVIGYNAHGSTGVAQPSKSEYDGLSPEKSKPSWGIDYDGILKVVQMGGTIVSTGKAFIGTGLAFDNLGPVVITAVDPKTNTDYRDYKLYADEEAKTGNGTQKGSFINKADITISGDLIFDKIYVLTRTDGQGEFHVVNGANLVIRDTVQFMDMNPDDAVKTPVLNLEKNGVAFLHAVGFSDYIGTGTIVLDKKLIDEGKITTDAFANFKGTVIDETGAAIYSGKDNASADTTAADTTAESKAPETTKAPSTTKATSTTKTPETTKAPDTTSADNTNTDEAPISPIVLIVSGVSVAAVIAVIVVVVIKKKKAE